MPARLPDLAEVRDKVEAGWRAAKADELTDRLYQEIRSRFTIEIEGEGT